VHDYKSRAYVSDYKIISFFARRFVIQPEKIPQKWHGESRKGIVDDNYNEDDNTLALFRKKRDIDEARLDAFIAKYEYEVD